MRRSKQILLLGLLTGFTPVSAVELFFENLSNSDTMVIEYHPIGEFHTDLSPQTGAPRQGIIEPENNGIIEIHQEYREALKNLDRCEYIIVLYHMHLSKEWHTMVRPPNSTRDVGLFASRSPNRPNPIGLAVIKVDHMDEGKIYVSGVDAFDGTPVLDIKPWLPSIDCPDHNHHSTIEKDVGLTE